MRGQNRGIMEAGGKDEGESLCLDPWWMDDMACLSGSVLWKEPHERLPYWNPTQVGECKCTKVSKEGHLRNSAKSPRKFARRGAEWSKDLLVAGNRRVRLFTKNTSLRKVERRRMWADACHVPVIGQRL